MFAARHENGRISIQGLRRCTKILRPIEKKSLYKCNLWMIQVENREAVDCNQNVINNLITRRRPGSPMINFLITQPAG